MNLINEAYNTNGSEKWIKRDLCPRIRSLEQVEEMIPNAYITRHVDDSKEIIGVVIAELGDDVINIGPFATRPKFQVLFTYTPSCDGTQNEDQILHWDYLVLKNSIRLWT